MLAEYKNRRQLTLNCLEEFNGVSCLRPKGAFYVFPDFSRVEESDEKLAIDILEKVGVVTVPGSGFGAAGTGHLRISYSTNQEQIKEGMNRIKSYMESRS
jgi:aminotransferase